MPSVPTAASDSRDVYCTDWSARQYGDLAVYFGARAGVYAGPPRGAVLPAAMNGFNYPQFGPPPGAQVTVSAASFNDTQGAPEKSAAWFGVFIPAEPSVATADAGQDADEQSAFSINLQGEPSAASDIDSSSVD
jgi:hypothetical protein